MGSIPSLSAQSRCPSQCKGGVKAALFLPQKPAAHSHEQDVNDGLALKTYDVQYRNIDPGGG